MSYHAVLPRGVAILAVLVAAQVGSNAAVVVDDFSTPEPMTAIVIDLLDPDPTLLETAGPPLAAVGGERDVLIDVMGTPGLVSFSGTVGGHNDDAVTHPP